jgi:predicted nuclease of restriction endonuclease-like (RecB) superfamily
MTRAPRKKPRRATSKNVPSAVTPVAVVASRGRRAPDIAPLFDRIVLILEDARTQVVRSVNSAMVIAYWQIGRALVEYFQAGDVRAEYGKGLVEELSQRLIDRLGRGYSTTNLRYFRTFYLAYADRSPRIRHMAGGESAPTSRTPPPQGRPRKIRHMAGGELAPTSRTPPQGGPRKIRHMAGGVFKDLEQAIDRDAYLPGFSPILGWSHYRLLMNVEHEPARRFYEIEAERGAWSVPHLERQIHTQLFARLLKSRDKAGVLDLATRGQVLERPADVIKHPYVLDFLGLPESPKLRESDLESTILEKLQHFLLELGKGFAFVARQKRLSFEDEQFYIDLVFYNVILKCYLLVDLKLGKLTHQDVGQMDSYVRLFDAQARTGGDGPTIGLILCAEKNAAIARYSVLHENEQLFAAKYVTYLPSVKELERELAREKRSLETGAAASLRGGKRPGRSRRGAASRGPASRRTRR